MSPGNVPELCDLPRCRAGHHKVVGVCVDGGPNCWLCPHLPVRTTLLRTHSHYLGQLPQTRRRKCWRANCLAQRRSGWRVGELGARSEVPAERRALPRPAGTGQLCAQMQLLQHLPCRGSKPANTLALLWSFPPIGRASWTQGPGQVTPGPPPVLHPTDTSDQVWMATACRPHSPAVTAQPILPDPIATRRSGLGPPQPIYDADPPPKRDKHQNHLLYPPAPPTPAPCWRFLGAPRPVLHQQRQSPS